MLPDADGTPVLSVSVACGKWVFLAVPEDKSSDPLMLNWKKNGTLYGQPFNGPVFDAPKYSTGGFRDPTYVAFAVLLRANHGGKRAR